MKRIFYFLFGCFGFWGTAGAQNTFPASGNVGINTLAPGAPLDVRFGTSFSQAGGNATAIQSRSSNNIGSGFWQANQLYAEQTAATSGDFVALSATTVTSHTSGNVALAIPVSFVHMHTGAGTVGEIHSVDNRLIYSASAGNITNGIIYYGTMGVFNGGTPANTVQNGYGLFIQPFPSNVQNKYGVYINDATANNYFGGSLSIGTTSNFGYQLAVNGSAIFTRAVVKLFSNWPDYVFKKGYVLPSLKEVDEYIRANNHLPGMPSAEEVEKDGVDLGPGQAALLKKIEELTLYTIGLQKQLEEEKEGRMELQRQVEGMRNKGRR
jgi:hypothetical protein